LQQIQQQQQAQQQLRQLITETVTTAQPVKPTPAPATTPPGGTGTSARLPGTGK
jgi:hypothetical protein